MAVSVARVSNPLPYQIVGAQKETITDVTLDNSFASGGEPLVPSDLGLSKVSSSWCQIKSVGGTVNVANAVYDNSALLHVYDETPAEVTGDLSNVVITVTAYGH